MKRIFTIAALFMLSLGWTAALASTPDAGITVVGGSVELGPDTTICTGNVIVLDAGAGWDAYAWSTGVSTQVDSIEVDWEGDSTFIVVGIIFSPPASSTDTIVITGNLQPTIAIEADTVCFGETTTVTNLSTGIDTAGVLWSLDFFNDGSIDIVDAPFIPDSSFVLLDTFGVIEFKGWATNPGGCSDTLVGSIFIGPIPDLDIVMDPVCEGDTTWVVDMTTNTDSTTLYSIDIGDDGSIEIVDTNALPTWFYFDTAGTYPIKFWASGATGCIDSMVFSAVVNLQPSIMITSDTACAGDPTTITNISTGIEVGALWSLDFFNDGSVDLADLPVLLDSSFILLDTSGWIQFRAFGSNPSGCVDTLIDSILIYPTPWINIMLTDACDGDTTWVSDMSTGTDSTTLWSWDVGDDGSMEGMDTTLPTWLLFDSAGVYTIKFWATNATGCTDSMTFDATVHVQPSLMVTSDTACFGTPTTVTNISTGVDSGAVWSLDFFNDGSVDLVDVPVLPDSSFIVLDTFGFIQFKAWGTNPSGCSDTLLDSIWILPPPMIDISVDTVCLGDTNMITNATVTDSAALWSWDVGDDGSYEVMDTNVTPTWIFIDSAGVFPVKFKLTNGEGCMDSVVVDVVVNPTPVVDVTADTVCFGNVTHIMDMSTGLVPGSMYFVDLWRDDSLEVDSALGLMDWVVDTFGVIPVNVWIENPGGCVSDTLMDTIVVLASPQPDIVIDTVCFGDTTTVFNNSTGLDAGTLWYLDFNGDGIPEVDGVPVIADSQFVLTTLDTTYWTGWAVNGNGCSDTLSGVVFAYGVPTADFSSSTVCFGNETEFTNLASGELAGAWYDWDFNSGEVVVTGDTTGMNQWVSFAGYGDFPVSQTVTNMFGCSDTWMDTASVLQSPMADLRIDLVCFGDTTRIINLTTETDSATTYNLDISADTTYEILGGSSPELDTVFGVAGTYDFIMEVMNSNGCADTFWTSVVVDSFLAIDLGPNMIMCDGDVLTLDAGVPDISYVWSTGDSSQTIDVMVTDTYYVDVAIDSGCTGSDTIWVQFNPIPVVDLGVDTGFCEGSGYVLDAGNAGYNYTWSTGDSTQIIVADSANMYSVWVYDSVGCGSSDTVNLVTSVLAPFTILEDGPAFPCIGDSIVLSSDTTFDFYSWNTGETTQSISVFVSDKYTLIVSDTIGCTDSTSLNVTINPFPKPNPVIGPDPANLCAGSSLTLEVGEGFFLYDWSTSEATSNIEVTSSGTYGVTVYNGFGCSNSDDIEVVDVTNPTVTITQSGNTMTASGATTYQWYLDGVAIVGATGSIYITTTNGNYSVEGWDANGCSGTSDAYMFVGIAEGLLEGISIFPNPTTGMLNISSLAPINGGVSFSLVNLVGQEVLNVQHNDLITQRQLDVSAVTNGIYFLKVTTGDAGTTVKVMVEK